MPTTFSHWPSREFDLGGAYVPLPDTALDSLLADEEQQISEATTAWASELMDEHIYSGNGFFILDGSSYPDLGVP